MGNVLAANVPPLSLASLPNTSANRTDGKMMLWKLTRVMKAAGWVYKSSGVGNTALVKNTSLATTIAAGSNGVALPQATINVASTTGFPASGTIFVVTSLGTQTVTYTGVGATTFTGAAGGTGTMSTGFPVIPANAVAANPNQDLWNGYGDQLPGQSGSTADFSAITSSVVTVTGLTGMSASSVGRVLILSGASTADSNGVFRIVTFTNATTVGIYNVNGSSSDANDGRINWQEMDFAAYVSGQIGAAASITTVSTPARVVTVTGLTGMTPLSTNRYLTITNAASTNNNGTFKILSFISATSVTIINFSGVASDANNGTIIWKETDPLLENYVLLQQNAWLCMQGPSTLRVPITTASTGTFLRGENITQTTTGAQGEVIGYTLDTVAAALSNTIAAGSNGVALPQATINVASTTGFPTAGTILVVTSAGTQLVTYTGTGATTFTGASGGTGTMTTGNAVTVANVGYLVVMPRVHGTGTGALGWGTNLITGGTSGATVTPSSNPSEFTREAVFYCPSTTNTANAMTMWMQVVDGYTTVGTENASRFSVLQASTGCTAAVPPGGTGTGNTYPTPGTQTMMGSSTTGVNSWGAMGTIDNFGYSHFMCADTTYDTNRSADGSFCGAVSIFDGNVATNNTNGSFIGCLWTRCDAQEEGDVDPYIFYLPSNTTLYTGVSRTAALTEYANSEQFNASSAPIIGSVTWGNHTVRAWRRRGFATGDGYQNCSLFTIGHTTAGNSFVSGATGSLNQYNDPANIITRNNAVVGEPIWVVSAQNIGKVRKGTMRWARLVNAGTATDLYQGGLYIQLSSSLPAFIVGPWDKRTFPIK